MERGRISTAYGVRNEFINNSCKIKSINLEEKEAIGESFRSLMSKVQPRWLSPERAKTQACLPPINNLPLENTLEKIATKAGARNPPKG